MRILIIAFVLISPFFYLDSEDVVVTSGNEDIDAIKVKLGAPKRVKAERILTVKPSEKTPASGASGNHSSSGQTEGNEEEGLEQVEEVTLTDLEEAWHKELKSMLNRLEPVEGDEIFTQWKNQQSSYQAEMDALLVEKQQKTHPKESQEIEHLILSLEERHQGRLKEILGAHFEAVRDQYDQFMESHQ